MRSFEGKMSFKVIMRRLVMAFVLGGYSVLGIGMSREKKRMIDARVESIQRRIINF
jgi:hypothetical protein